MKEDEIIYSGRWKHKIKSDNPKDGLYEQFRIVVEKSLMPYFDKMVKKKVFRDLRAFGDWDTGFNKFSVEIFGFHLPENLEFEGDLKTIQDYEHLQENLFTFNSKLLEQLLNMMNGQNITGQVDIIRAEFQIAVIEHFYGFKVVWTCYPQIVQTEQSKNAHNN